jgi:hypothetical protein
MATAASTTLYRLVSQSDHLGTWLTFAGAITVSVVAAGTAQWRLRSQLSAELEREREKQSFDRGETDRAELRSILDALAEALGRLESAVYAFTARLDVDEQAPHEAQAPETLGESGPRSRNPTRDAALAVWRRLRSWHWRLVPQREVVAEPTSVAAASDRLQRAQRDARSAFLDARREIGRLDLRLGSEGKTVVDAAHAATAEGARIGLLSLDHPTELRVLLTSADKDTRDACEEFTKEALSFTGARLHQAPPSKRGFRFRPMFLRRSD